MAVLIVLIVVVTVLIAYRLSLTLHPFTRCEVCKGGSRHPGAIFSYATRPCHACSGRGTKQRAGAKLLGLGEPRYPRPTGRWAQKSSFYPTPDRRRRFFWAP